MSHLICTVAFVGDRDHYGANTEKKKHITAGQVAEGKETQQRSSEGSGGLPGMEGAVGRGDPCAPSCQAGYRKAADASGTTLPSDAAPPVLSGCCREGNSPVLPGQRLPSFMAIPRFISHLQTSVHTWEVPHAGCGHCSSPGPAFQSHSLVWTDRLSRKRE